MKETIGFKPGYGGKPQETGIERKPSNSGLDEYDKTKPIKFGEKVDLYPMDASLVNFARSFRSLFEQNKKHNKLEKMSKETIGLKPQDTGPVK